MSRNVISTNIHKRKLIRQLEKLSDKTDKAIWEKVSEILSRPRRKRVAVNIGKINRLANDGEIIIVPGRVLGGGLLEKKLVVIAESFSKTAWQKILDNGGKPYTLYDVVSNPSLVEGKKGLKLIV
ncbi:MAG: 50S ribosomal protein L18e [Desulfurococcales archaeon]|jgi:large subunit ribosomal protein L18e|nr:50S ribosomal protein L18e [Desulfurococcales archaeon]